MNAATGLDSLLEPLSLCLDAESARRLVAFRIDPQVVVRMAGGCCEYCQLRQEHSAVPHQIEHIVARQHGGGDDIENLALA